MSARFAITVSPVYVGNNLKGFVGGGIWIGQNGIQSKVYDVVWVNWVKAGKPEHFELNSSIVDWYFMNFNLSY